jgi:hypothetical protein
MSLLVRPHPTTEGRSSGSRIDLAERGRYLNSPRNRSVRAFTSVQGTGCGTSVTSEQRDLCRKLAIATCLTPTLRLVPSENQPP